MHEAKEGYVDALQDVHYRKESYKEAVNDVSAMVSLQHARRVRQ